MGPDDAVRGRKEGLGIDRAEGASWMRKRRRVADKAFIVRVRGRAVGLCVVVRVVASSGGEVLGVPWPRKRKAGWK